MKFRTHENLRFSGFGEIFEISRLALSAEVSSLWREHYTVGLLLLEGGREKKGNFDTQKVYIKFESLRVFYWDFLRNWHLYGTLIWESMSFRKTKLLMKLAE